MQQQIYDFFVLSLWSPFRIIWFHAKKLYLRVSNSQIEDKKRQKV
jgi:hypothetical protein